MPEKKKELSTIDMLKKVFKDEPLIEKYSSDNSSDNSTGIKEKIQKIEKDSEHIAIISSIFGVGNPENDKDESYINWYNSLVDNIKKDINNIPQDMIKEIKE